MFFFLSSFAEAHSTTTTSQWMSMCGKWMVKAQTISCAIGARKKVKKKEIHRWGRGGGGGCVHFPAIPHPACLQSLVVVHYSLLLSHISLAFVQMRWGWMPHCRISYENEMFKAQNAKAQNEYCKIFMSPSTSPLTRHF